MENTKMKQETHVNQIDILKKHIKYLICWLICLSVIVFALLMLIVYKQWSISVISIDAYIGVGVTLIAGLATIIVANHFIAIFNFNNKINEIEKEVETVRLLKKTMIHTQVENNNALAHNTYLEGKMLKAIIIELDNLYYIIKNRNYFNDEDKEFRKRLEAKVGYIANNFVHFIEDRKYESCNYNIVDAILDIKTSYRQLTSTDFYYIEIKLNVIFNIIINTLENIVKGESFVILDSDMEKLKYFQKK